MKGAFERAPCEAARRSGARLPHAKPPCFSDVRAAPGQLDGGSRCRDSDPNQAVRCAAALSESGDQEERAPFSRRARQRRRAAQELPDLSLDVPDAAKRLQLVADLLAFEQVRPSSI